MQRNLLIVNGLLNIEVNDVHAKKTDARSNRTLCKLDPVYLNTCLIEIACNFSATSFTFTQ